MQTITTLCCLLAALIIPQTVCAGIPIDTVMVSEAATLETATGTLHGSLLMPTSQKAMPLVIILSGSGPTDRDGNQGPLMNNSLKLFAKALGYNGIATLRYDKRGIAGSKAAGKPEKDMRIEDFMNDASAWIKRFKGDKRFSRIVVAGHSEGSLIGMVAAHTAHANAFISLAGTGFPADKVLKTQFQSLPLGTSQITTPILDSLRAGKTVSHVPPMLQAVFRPSVQPYLMSWFAYDPSLEIKKLNVPVLIVQGTTDIQVSVEDARALATAKPDAKLVLIEGMNHILKQAPKDRMQNMATYNNGTLPIVEELVKVVCGFVEGVSKSE